MFDINYSQLIQYEVLEKLVTSIVQNSDESDFERLVIQPVALTMKHSVYANPVILGGLFPNGKYVGMWLPVLNR